MSSTRQIKSRIRSVSSNKQITKAMELVAASKLRRAQEGALQTREYAEAAREVLGALGGLTEIAQHPLFRHRTVKTRLVILITSDRGLAGAYNTNALKVFSRELAEDQAAGVSTRVICIGQKGAQYASRLRDVMVESIYKMPETVTALELRPILEEAVDLYRDGVVDAVSIVGTHFANSFTQTARLRALLPAAYREVTTVGVTDARFEPSPEEVLSYAVVRLIEAQLFQAVLDASASEHAMRRVAMKNASDNASDIIDALTLEMNKVRQAGITQELSEISAGVEAMK